MPYSPILAKRVDIAANQWQMTMGVMSSSISMLYVGWENGWKLDGTFCTDTNPLLSCRSFAIRLSRVSIRLTEHVTGVTGAVSCWPSSHSKTSGEKNSPWKLSPWFKSTGIS